MAGSEDRPDVVARWRAARRRVVTTGELRAAYEQLRAAELDALADPRVTSQACRYLHAAVDDVREQLDERECFDRVARLLAAWEDAGLIEPLDGRGIDEWNPAASWRRTLQSIARLPERAGVCSYLVRP